MVTLLLQCNGYFVSIYPLMISTSGDTLKAQFFKCRLQTFDKLKILFTIKLQQYQKQSLSKQCRTSGKYLDEIILKYDNNNNNYIHTYK